MNKVRENKVFFSKKVGDSAIVGQPKMEYDSATRGRRK